jgi:thioesterase domain-containing protein
VFTDEIPRTFGKVQRVGLAQRYGLGPRTAPPESSELPVSETQKRLAQIWGRLLKLEYLPGRFDDFFALGGDSLAGIAMLLEVEAEFGVRLLQPELLRSGRLDQLAHSIENAAGDETTDCLVTIQTGGTRMPIFWVHNVTGGIMSAATLAFHLGPDQPVYAIQPHAVDGKGEPDREIEKMADRYVALVRDAHPRGPFVVGGHSAGGTIAFEMARKLGAVGRRPALVVLGDCMFGGTGAYIAWTLGYLLHADAGERWASFRRFTGRLAQRPLQRSGPGQARVPGPAPAWNPNRMFDSEDMASWGVIRGEYRPGTYAGDVLYLRATKGSVFGTQAPWRKVITGSLVVRDVPGTHIAMFSEPNVGTLARALAAEIDRIKN